MRRTLASCAIVLNLLAGCMVAQTAKLPVKPGKIFVGSFGMGDDAEQLKLALGYELTRVGFKIVDFESQADTVLSGLIVTRLDGNKQVKRVTVFLKDKSGKTVWNQDIGSTGTGSHSDSEAIRRRAEEIASVLKRDLMSGKKAASKG